MDRGHRLLRLRRGDLDHRPRGAVPVSRAILTSNRPGVRSPSESHAFSGGPDRTRICDLYRVKVLRSIDYRVPSMKTRDLQEEDLDRKWTSAGGWTSRGPHIFRGRSRALTRVIDSASWCCRSTTTLNSPIRMK